MIFETIEYNPEYSRITGSLKAGILLSVLYQLYKSNGNKPFKITNQELCQITFLSKNEFSSAKNKLKDLRIISTNNKNKRGATEYEINESTIIQLTENQLTENQLTENQATENQLTENQATENQATENQATEQPPEKSMSCTNSSPQKVTNSSEFQFVEKEKEKSNKKEKEKEYNLYKYIKKYNNIYKNNIYKKKERKEIYKEKKEKEMAKNNQNTSLDSSLNSKNQEKETNCEKNAEMRGGRSNFFAEPIHNHSSPEKSSTNKPELAENGILNSVTDAKNRIPEKKNENYQEKINKIIEYLNEKNGSKYSPRASLTVTKIKARLKEGYELEDFYKVIDLKISEWGEDEKMKKYIRPETLFSKKFDRYLNEAILKNQKKSVNYPKIKMDLDDINPEWRKRYERN